MTTIFLLTIILLILMIIVGGKRGLTSFVTLYLNFFIFFMMVILIAYNFNPIIIALLGSIIISIVTLFIVNGVNEKTIASFISIIITLILLFLFVYLLTEFTKVQGFGEEEIDAISPYSLYININYLKITVCTIIIGLIGAIIDASISISSAMSEINIKNKDLSKKELYLSGINIGKDILGTSTNTLYFAFLGGFMTLLIWFKDIHYSLDNIINSKVFSAEILQIISSGIGIVIIIPITAFITTFIIKCENKDYFNNLTKNVKK